QGATAEFAITALNPALERIGSLSKTFPLVPGGEEVNEIFDVSYQLETIIKEDRGGVVLFQTLGTPAAPTAGTEMMSVWEGLGEALSHFGGTQSVWDSMDGTGNYSLVGAAYGSGESAIEIGRASCRG